MAKYFEMYSASIFLAIQYPVIGKKSIGKDFYECSNCITMNARLDLQSFVSDEQQIDKAVSSQCM